MASNSLQNIKTFKSSFNSLTVTPNIFTGNTSLEKFEANMPLLTNGYEMFANCSALTTFKGDLDNIVSAERMFYNTSLIKFEGNLESLVNCNDMFSGCITLTDFISPKLTSLINGDGMF